MLNIPEKLLEALGFSRDINTKSDTSDISKDASIIPTTASARALLDTLKDVNQQASNSNFDDYAHRHYHNFAYSFKSELNYTRVDYAFLSSVDFSENTFNVNHHCRREIIRLFLAVVRNWIRNIWQRYMLDINAYLEQLGALVARKEYRFRAGSWNFRDTLRKTERLVFTRIFQFCENQVRNTYNQGRQLMPRLNFTNKEVLSRFEEITKEYKTLIVNHASIIEPTNSKVEIELNAQNKNRWKIYLEQILKNLDTIGVDKFIAQIMKLYTENSANKNNSLIFLEAAKSLATNEQYRILALKMYVYYGYCQPKDAKLKSLLAKDKKIMLPNAEALKFYKEYIENQHFRTFGQVAFFKIIDDKFGAAIAPPARKKIIIDHQAVAETKAALHDTIALLSDILADEELTTNVVSATTKQIPPIQEVANDKYIKSLGLNAIQIALLDLFYANDLCLSSEIIKQFAQEHKISYNALIDSINEICFELLDDVLIEENSPNNYNINSLYFSQISHD